MSVRHRSQEHCPGDKILNVDDLVVRGPSLPDCPAPASGSGIAQGRLAQFLATSLPGDPVTALQDYRR